MGGGVTWARHGARMKEIGNSCEILNGRNLLEDLGVEGSIILKWMLNKLLGRV
jgi:hypothetical protein